MRREDEISVLWRSAGAYALGLAILGLAFVINYNFINDVVGTARYTVLGSLALWIGFPLGAIRYCRAHVPRVSPGEVARLPTGRWVSILIGFSFSAIADELGPLGRLICWDLAGACFSFAATLLALEQVYFRADGTH